MSPRRGEFWWVALDPTQGSEIAKTRPCVVVGRDTVNEYRRTVVVVPLSTSPLAHPPISVGLTCSGRKCVAVIDQIRAVSKERLKEKIGAATPAELSSISHAIRDVLDLDY